MKPIKRASCPLCKNQIDTQDVKADKQGISLKLKCAKDGTPLKLSSQWYVRATINGKREYVPCGLLKRDADDYIATFRVAKRTGSILPGQEKDITWAEAVANCNGWWDAALTAKSKHQLRANTREYYRKQVDVLSRYFAGMTLLTITKSKINDMMIDMEKAYAPASIAHAVRTLKRMYAMHIESLDMEETPRPKLIEKTYILSKVEGPIVDNISTVSLDRDGMQAILNSIETHTRRNQDKQRLRLCVMLGFGMLMRPMNICSLEWAEIDLPNKVMSISKEKMKGKRDFQQAIPDLIADELKSWRREMGLRSLYVFPSPKDPAKPMTTMAMAIRGHIAKCGLNNESTSRQDRIVPYSLRHSGATQLYEESGENLEMTSKIAGHADSNITRKRYVKNRVVYSQATAIPVQNAMLERMIGVKKAA